MENIKNLTNSNPEFRIFTYLNASNDESYFSNFVDPWKLNNSTSKIEERIDFYVLPLSSPNETSLKYGLKFRKIKQNKLNNFTCKLLELKIRNEINEKDIETWTKTSKKLKKKFTLFKSCASNIGNTNESEKNENKFLINFDDGIYEFLYIKTMQLIKENIKDLTSDKEYISSLDSLPLMFAFTYKLRTQSDLEEAYIKLVKFQIDVSNKFNVNVITPENFYLKSVCLENSFTLSQVEELKKEEIKDDSMTITAGYPEAIIKTKK